MSKVAATGTKKSIVTRYPGVVEGVRLIDESDLNQVGFVHMQDSGMSPKMQPKVCHITCL